MCSRLAGSGYIILSVMLGAGRADGQDLRELGRRLDASAARFARAQAAVEQRRRMHDAIPELADTVVIANGNVRVLATAAMAPTVRAAAARADSSLQRVPSLLPRAAGTVIAVVPDTAGDRTGLRPSPRVFVRRAQPPYRVAVTNDAAVDAGAIARVIEEQTMVVTLGGLHTQLHAWHPGSFPLQVEEDDAVTDWGAVRFDVLASRALIGPRCYAGEIAACSMLLGLSHVEDPVMSWYDSLARIDEVQANRDWALRNNRVATERCLGGDDRACGDALRAIHHYQVAPGGGIARDALLREAVRLGGDGATERMLASRGSVAEAIAAGAGVPADSVIRVWHRRLRAGSLGSDDLTPRMALIALVWVALLFLASTRITRWR